MSPALNAGDYIICKNIKPRSIRPGLIYVITHSDLGRIVKRVSTMRGHAYILCGDNPSSTPSEVMGPVTPERITKRAIFAITKSGIRKL